MNYYQQGDVLLKRINQLPDGCQKLETKVLQLGEVTGHKHQFPKTADVEVYVAPEFAGKEQAITPDEGKFIWVGENEVQLLHEEHNPITIDPGYYQVDIVREFDYDSMEAKRVVD
jgi:hypothetical protein